MTVSIEIVDVSHEYRRGSGHVLKDVSLTVEPGEFVTLLGPSGSGKTTLLKLIAGLARPSHGLIRLGGRDVTHMPINKRNIGLVFQHYALFPHLTVYANIAFPLKLRGVSRGDVRRRTMEALDLVGLKSYERAYPRELSGGQQQRVAVARAIVFNPDVLLLDEPLGALDRRLRERLTEELRRLQREIGVTTVYVTHDQYEALVLSNRIAVMRDGEIRQIAPPADVYQHPADDFVAEFMGDINMFDCNVVAKRDTIFDLHTKEGLRLVAHANGASSVAAVGEGSAVRCAVRPESLNVSTQRTEADMCWEGHVTSVLFRGSTSHTLVETERGRVIVAEVPTVNREVREGGSVWVTLSAKDVMIF